MKTSIFRWSSFLVFVFLFNLQTTSTAQEKPGKFGKVEPKDLEAKVYDKDSSAEAVVLFDIGNSRYGYNSDKGFQTDFERTTRIKIFKKSGYEKANQAEVLYHDGMHEEKMYDIKAFTYSLDNGKVVKTKMEKEAITEEVVDEHYKIKKFTIPAVKEGCIIEFTYTIKSDFLYRLRDWQFQFDIPVAYSEYTVTIPEYFEYKQIMQGFEPIQASSEKTRFTFSYRYREEDERLRYGSGRPATQYEQIDASATLYKFIGQNLPAMKEEPYITTLEDYETKIQFELASIQYPGQIRKPFKRSWDELTTQLVDDERFGKQLNRGNFLKDAVASLKGKYSNSLDLAQAICYYVKNEMKWTGERRVYPEGSLKKAFDLKKGNAADINLLLVLMLREAGLEANPVILSTRDHGRINPTIPLLTKFNYVIAHVALDGKYLLMDATEPFLPAHLLPKPCLNGNGRLISATKADWVEVKNQERNVEFFTAKLSLDKDGLVKGTVDETFDIYKGLELRRRTSTDGKEKIGDELKKRWPNWEVDKFELSNIDKLGESLKANCSGVFNDAVRPAGNLLYISPLLGRGTSENPFKADARKYPIDFATPFEDLIIIQLSLPEGYAVEELPKSAIVDLPDNSGRFTYSVKVVGNTMMVTSKVVVKRSFFSMEEFDNLKSFYNYIVTKHAEQAVLKKI